MRRPRMSTGAWIFATAALVLAVAAPVSYAAATSTVAIGNPSGTSTALVDAEHQLLTTPIPPKNVVQVFVQVQGSGGPTCNSVYAPPAGKAIVVTSVTYEMGSTSDEYINLMNAGCTKTYDAGQAFDAYQDEQHTFPTGLPMPSVSAQVANGTVQHIGITGYLIAADQLPS